MAPGKQASSPNKNDGDWDYGVASTSGRRAEQGRGSPTRAAPGDGQAGADDHAVGP